MLQNDVGTHESVRVISWLLAIKEGQEMYRELITVLSLLDTPAPHKVLQGNEATKIQHYPDTFH